MNTAELIVKLHEKGFKKVTPQRLAICEFILSSKEHPTVEQVYQAVQKKYPTLSIATVYQNPTFTYRNWVAPGTGLS